MRLLADLPDDDVAWLDERASRLGISRAQLLREAVAAYRAEARRDGIEHYFGIWSTRDETGK